jgi:hypothetical protein
MADETRKLQKDPPEGSRKVVEHELDRQSDKEKRGAQKSGTEERGSRSRDAERPGPEGGRR